MFDFSHAQPANSASAMGDFGRLPRELRDMIYKCYLVVEDGYICDSSALIHGALSGIPDCKLRRFDKGPVDLALVFTCKSIAEEMYRGGLALRVNTITFSTFYSDELRLHAGTFGYMRETDIEEENVNIFPYLRKCLRGPVYDELRNAYPVFTPVLDAIREGRPTSSIYPRPHYGQARSLYSRFVKHGLQLAAYYHYPEFVEAVDQRRILLKRQRRGQLDPEHIAYCSAEAWDIPTHDDLLHLASHVWATGKRAMEGQLREALDPGNLSKFRFSAAASAIRFLRAMPENKRANLRSIVLDEDRESVSNPACHAQGLIPFCRENRLLRVERRCSLWRNIFCGDWETDNDRQHRFDKEYPEKPKLLSSQITWNVSQWIMEALVLEFYGMPADSFSLVLDGNPGSQQCEAIFQQIVQRDVAWQLARREARNRGYLPMKTWMEQNEENTPRAYMFQDYGSYDYGYTFEDFPQAMQDIAKGDSIVRCNFQTGTPWDVEKILKERRRWTESTWNDDWFNHEPKSWETTPPMPSWEDLLREDLLPRGNYSSGDPLLDLIYFRGPEDI